MFLSIKQNPYLAKHAKVLLDGVDISNQCYSADEEHGTAFCYVWGSDGKIVINESKHEPAREIRRGKVKIILDGYKK